MTLRILITGVVCVVLSFGTWHLYQPVSPAAAIAAQLAGEYWYSLALDGQHLGYWHTRTGRNRAGHWVFESEQRFAIDRHNPISTKTTRTFTGQPPHLLLSAAHTQSGRRSLQGVQFEATEDGYRSERLPPGTAPATTLDWRYGMADYLDFELWLDSEQPNSGRARTVPTLDFERGTLINRTFDVVERTPGGYVVENAAPLTATRIQLDEHYAPVDVKISGLFNLHRTTRSAALAPRSTLQSASYYIPLDQRLVDHTRISRLVVGVAGEGADLFDVVKRKDRKDDGWQLTLTANPVSSGKVIEEHLAETLHIPSTHPDITILAREAIAGFEGDLIDDLKKAQALTRFVSEYLRYEPGEPSRSVLTLLDDPRGDCTEFADLLTTLARNVGLPARTVFGLAYADGSADGAAYGGMPAFAYHAWNELFVLGRWIAMDPTWGQVRVDATHIPLPADETAALKLLTGSVQLAFSILEVEHFPD